MTPAERDRAKDRYQQWREMPPERKGIDQEAPGGFQTPSE